MKLDRIKALFDDPGPFATAYAEINGAAAQAAYDELVGQGAPKGVAESVRARLVAATPRPAPVSRCVVASERGVLLDELTAVHRDDPRHSWGALPDLADWVQDASLAVPYVLAVVDPAGGRAQTFSDGGPCAGPDAGARAPGEVIEEIRRQLAGGPGLLVLAGDARSRLRVEGDLGPLPIEIIQLDHGGPAEDGDDEVLADEIREVLQGRLIASRLDRLHELGQQLGRGHRVAVGVREVAEAFARDQVDTLYLDPVAAAEQDLDPADHPGLTFGAAAVTGPVPADRALVALACLHDADVITAGTEHLFGTPVAAVLRWGQAG